MPKRRRQLIIDANGPGASLFKPAAEALDIELYLAVHHRYVESIQAREPFWRGHVVGVDLTKHDQTVDRLSSFMRQERVTGVVTLDEFLVPITAEIAAEVGLRGAPLYSVDMLHNKAAMAKAFELAEVCIPKTVVVAPGVNIVEAVASSGLHFPLIGKPADNAGSMGVARVRTNDELVAWGLWAIVLERDVLYDIPLDRRLLIQEDVRGREFSVESVVSRGEIRHLAVTSKMLAHNGSFAEVGHDMPASLDPETESHILREAGHAIAAVGVSDGMTHSELIVRGTEVVVLEVAARLGGGPIGRLLRETCNVDPYAMAIQSSQGMPISIMANTRRYAAARYLVSLKDGDVAHMNGLPEIERESDVMLMKAKVGASVHALRSNSDRLGYFIVSGDNLASVKARATALERKFILDVV